MSCCISIEALIVPRNFPTHYLEGGRFFFDVGQTESFRLTKAVGELSDVNRIKDEAVLGFDLPLTDKNRAFFNLTGLLLLGTIENKYPPITVAARAGTKYLRQRDLYLISIDDTAQVVSCELRPNMEHWVRSADELFLSEIPFNQYVHDLATVTDLWVNNEAWDPTKVDAYTPLVHYGGFRDGTEMAYLEDLRPWHFVRAVLDRGFCAINWKFESEALESQWGSRLICYLLAEDFWDYENRGDNYRVDVRMLFDEDVSAFGPIQFDIEDWDGGNNYTLGGSQYANFQPDGFNCKVILEGQMEASAAGLFDFAITFPASGAFIELTVELDAGLNDILIESECFYMAPGAVFQIGNGTFPGGTATLKAGFTMAVRPCDERIFRGDTLKLETMIDPDYRFLDFIKGVVALGFKIETDWGARVVRFLPAGEDTDVFGTDVAGFYGGIDSALDFNEKVVCESRKASIPSDDQPRFVRYRFAKSDDTFIEDNGLEEDAPLWSRLLDLGEHLPEEEKVYENPFFEPTANINWGDVLIPACWDNNDGAPSFGIGPRIMYVVGREIQTEFAGIDVILKYWNWEGTEGTQAFMPLAMQAGQVSYGIPPVDLVRNVAYKVPDDFPVQLDLFKVFLRLEAVYSVYSPEVEFLVDLSLNDYFSCRFRDLAVFVYQGRQLLCRIDRISDFDTCADIPTPVILRPEPMLFDLPECLTIVE